MGDGRQTNDSSESRLGVEVVLIPVLVPPGTSHSPNLNYFIEFGNFLPVSLTLVPEQSESMDVCSRIIRSIIVDSRRTSRYKYQLDPFRSKGTTTASDTSTGSGIPDSTEVFTESSMLPQKIIRHVVP